LALTKVILVCRYILQDIVIKRFYYIREITLSFLLLASGSVYAWGPQGHRITTRLAEPYLSEPTKLAIREILGNEDLARASTWVDIMRSHPSPYWQDRAGAYHYVTVPPGRLYADVGAPTWGDAMTALTGFRRTLEDPDSSMADKQIALRFSIHIVQDLHQPLHVGNGKDRGGNQFELRFLGKSTNLHRVWDSGLFKSVGRGESEWVRYLRRRLTPQQTANWTQTDPHTWIAESATLRDQIYPDAHDVGQAYIAQHLPAMETKLCQAAIRTAAYLNELLDR
jgi:hypothetical protein